MSVLFGACMRGDARDMVPVPGMMKTRRHGGSTDWPVVWSPRSSLSDESGIEMEDGGSAGAAAVGSTLDRQVAAARLQAVSQWIGHSAHGTQQWIGHSAQGTEQSVAAEIHLQQPLGCSGTHGDYRSPTRDAECRAHTSVSVDASPAIVRNTDMSLRPQHQYKASISESSGTSEDSCVRSCPSNEDVRLDDSQSLSPDGSRASLLDQRPTPILPGKKQSPISIISAASHSMLNEQLSPCDMPHQQYNHTVVKDFSAGGGSGSEKGMTVNTIDVLKGELVNVVHIDNGWAYVITMDHYCGYVPASYLAKCTPAVLAVSGAQNGHSSGSGADGSATPTAQDSTQCQHRHRLQLVRTGGSSTHTPERRTAAQTPTNVSNRAVQNDIVLAGPGGNQVHARMTSPTQSQVSSATVKAQEPNTTTASTGQRNDDDDDDNEVQNMDDPDGFWSSNPNANQGTLRKYMRRRRRTRSTELNNQSRNKAQTMVNVPSETLQRPTANQNSHQHRGNNSFSHCAKDTASNQENRSAPLAHTGPAPLSHKDTIQLQAPAAAATDFWYADGQMLSTPMEPFQTCRGEEVVCLYDFVAMDENDLSMVAGEQLVILNQTDSDWMWVSNARNQQGFVPAAYVQHVAEDSRAFTTTGDEQRMEPPCLSPASQHGGGGHDTGGYLV